MAGTVARIRGALTGREWVRMGGMACPSEVGVDPATLEASDMQLQVMRNSETGAHPGYCFSGPP